MQQSLVKLLNGSIHLIITMGITHNGILYEHIPFDE